MGMCMCWDMALIRKVLVVMSLKSQTDEDFLAATGEDHPPL